MLCHFYQNTLTHHLIIYVAPIQVLGTHSFVIKVPSPYTTWESPDLEHPVGRLSLMSTSFSFVIQMPWYPFSCPPLFDPVWVAPFGLPSCHPMLRNFWANVSYVMWFGEAQFPWETLSRRPNQQGKWCHGGPSDLKWMRTDKIMWHNCQKATMGGATNVIIKPLAHPRPQLLQCTKTY